MPTSLQTPSWRRAAAALTGVLALMLSLLLTAPTASAHDGSGHDGYGDGRHDDGGHGDGRHGFGYLALGDSVAFGYRPAEVTPPTAYLDASNFVGYPEVLAKRFGLRLTNASCPGETTASLIDETAQSNGCENSVDKPYGYRTVYPLHTAYRGSQLRFAVKYLRSHPRTRLVSIDVGANDLFLCQATTADHCTGTDFQATVARVEQNLDTILSTLRHRGHYHHRLVVLDYYSLNYADPVSTGAISALNAALARSADANGAVVADGFGAVRDAAASAGGDTCAAHLIIALPDGTCNVHPTLSGHQVLAGAVADAVRR